MVDRAEGAIEGMFYTYMKEEVAPEEHKTVVLVTNEQGDSLMNKLQFEEKMRLVFDDKDSLALKSLKEGIVDFGDKRVQIQGASLMEQNG